MYEACTITPGVPIEKFFTAKFAKNSKYMAIKSNYISKGATLNIPKLFKTQS